MKLKFKKLDEKAIIPHKAHPTDACFDMHIIVDHATNYPKSRSAGRGILTHTVSHGYAEDGSVDTSKIIVTIEPHCSVVFHTGLACEIEEGYCMKIHTRSSIGIKSALALSNGTGIIDAPYRGEILIALTNESDEPRTISHLERVAQCEITRVEDVEIEEVDELSETERGEGGIGSTGK